MKRKKNRYYNHLLVDMMYSQTHGEKTGSQGHFVTKGFSDLTVCSHTTLRTGARMQVLAHSSSIWPSDAITAISHLCFFIQIIWCDINPSAYSWRIKLLLTSALRLAGIMMVCTTDRNARPTLCPMTLYGKTKIWQMILQILHLKVFIWLIVAENAFLILIAFSCMLQLILVLTTHTTRSTPETISSYSTQIDSFSLQDSSQASFSLTRPLTSETLQVKSSCSSLIWVFLDSLKNKVTILLILPQSLDLHQKHRSNLFVLIRKFSIRTFFPFSSHFGTMRLFMPQQQQQSLHLVSTRQNHVR